jgi:D-sedoheptulose 7-phosphate isomerase
MNLRPRSKQLLEDLGIRYPLLADVTQGVINAVETICQCHNSGGKVLLCGNGGSAADAEHIVGELLKAFILPRKLTASETERLASVPGGSEMALKLQRGIAAVAIPASAPISTAIANDTDAQLVFAQQVLVLGRPGDVLIGLSTSGNSANVVNALKVGRAFGLRTIGFTGQKPAAMDPFCETLFKVPAIETYKIQEFHLPIYHAICLMCEEELFGATE